VVLATLAAVAVLLLSQQPVLTPILLEAAPGGAHTEVWWAPWDDQPDAGLE
jgi:hypothetical protein